MNNYELGTTVKLDTEFRDAANALVNPITVTLVITRPDSETTTVSGVTNPSVGVYSGTYTTVVEGEHTFTWTGSSPTITFTNVKSGFFVVVNYDATDVDTLIPSLRMQLGDWEEPYRYTMNTLRMSLVFAVKVLMKRWRSKYKIENDTTIVRNPNYTFEFAAPPTIQVYDEPAIVLQAAVLIMSGSLQEATWQTASWRDDEIQVSNIQGQRSRSKMLDMANEWLENYFKLRLYSASRQALGGFQYPLNWREG